MKNFFPPNDSISPFSLQTLSTKDFIWSPPNAWSFEDGLFYDQFIPADQLQLTKVPKVPIKNKKFQEQAVGKWILRQQDEAKELLAAAELHMNSSKFSSGHLVFHCANSAGNKLSLERCLSLLISGIFLESESDQLLLFQVDELKCQYFEDVGSSASILTPQKNFEWSKSVPGLFYEPVKITKSDWWDSQLGQENRKTLAYIEKRRDFAKKIAAKKAKNQRRRPTRGLLGRLFKP